MSDPLKQQFQTSNDASAPESSGRRQPSDLELVSQERMTILGLKGPGLPLAAHSGPSRFRQALDALLKQSIVTIRPHLAFAAGVKAALQRAQPVLIERRKALVPGMQRARHVLLERWMAADLRTRQLPILALATAIWVSTAWMAWRADDSATPLLRKSLAAKSQVVHHVEVTGGEASRGTAEPIAAPAESLTRETSTTLSLSQIVEFVISGTKPPRARLTNPRLQVWADTHTGLYYCPGEDGYRRRSRGHFMSQREARDNYFQPASGATCR